ncbi:hypothetical protein ZWY2020_008520 [Hordeum vulgare]|nr:hypothetical protein ZWY2020_008520 [Hordeum vulgare]
MAALAEHLGTGLQCMDVMRGSLEVLKHCAGVVLPESSLHGDMPVGATRGSKQAPPLLALFTTAPLLPAAATCNSRSRRYFLHQLLATCDCAAAAYRHCSLLTVVLLLLVADAAPLPPAARACCRCRSEKRNNRNGQDRRRGG